MALAAGLDTTNKHFTNHSVRKTTVQKLKKAGASATDIMAITGHKNHQSLADYSELDYSDHQKLGAILSSSNSEQQNPPAEILPVVEQVKPVSPHDTSSKSTCSGPVFNFTNSKVIFFGSSTSNTQYQHTELTQQCRKRFMAQIMADSDSD